MNTKHTPGPWKCPDITLDIITADRKQSIAVCHRSVDGNYKPGLQEAKANARLIAAAPELLEALKDCADWTRLCEHPEVVKLRHVDVVTEAEACQKVAQDNARAAIAKAEGRA